MRGESFLRRERRKETALDLLLEGCDNAEIASRMGCAERTVKAIFHSLFVEYNLSASTRIKRVQLAVKVYRERIAKEKANR